MVERRTVRGIFLYLVRIGAATASGILRDHAFGVGRVELAVGHEDHDLRQCLRIVGERLAFAGEQIREVRRDHVPAPCQADLTGRRPAIVERSNCIRQRRFVARKWNDHVRRTGIA